MPSQFGETDTSRPTVADVIALGAVMAIEQWSASFHYCPQTDLHNC